MRRSLSLGGVMPACAVAMVVCLSGAAWPAGRAHAAASLEERKLPMHFAWHGPARGDRAATDARPDAVTCRAECRGWVSAVGVITGDTPTAFADFAAEHDLSGTTIVLDSSGGSVLDAIKLGRQWRELGVTTTVGTVHLVGRGSAARPEIYPEAYCESMCVFLLLSGKARTVPAGAHVRVHQIWMGDRAEDATAANYSAQDVMIIERDVGRLAKYTFEMGGSGELLGLALSIPPWEPLHELTPSELRGTNLVSTDAVAAVPQAEASAAPHAAKPVQDRVAASPPAERDAAQAQSGASSATKTAEALPDARPERP
jgi:hypothetical protein